MYDTFAWSRLSDTSSAHIRPLNDSASFASISQLLHLTQRRAIQLQLHRHSETACSMSIRSVRYVRTTIRAEHSNETERKKRVFSMSILIDTRIFQHFASLSLCVTVRASLLAHASLTKGCGRAVPSLSLRPLCWVCRCLGISVSGTRLGFVN